MQAERLDRGFVVLPAAAVGVFMTTPGQTVGVASFVDPVALDLGLARELVILLYSLGTLLGILPAPLIGRFVDRYGPRPVVVVASLALGGSCFAMGAVANPWTLAIAFTLLRGSAIGGLSLSSLNMVNLWFERLRGRATAVALMGLAAGGLVVPRIAEWITINYGWRSAYGALGAAVLAIMVPVGLLFFRNNPRNYGMLPDFGRKNSVDGAPDRCQYTLAEATRTIVFWYLLLLAVLYNAVGTALLLDHVRLLESVGENRVVAIHLLGFVPVAQVLAVLGSGFLVDRIGARRAGLAGLAVLTLTLVSVMTAPYLFRGYLYVISLGATIGILQVAHSSGLAEYFGIRHLGTLRGTTFVVGVFGAAIGPLPFAWWPHAAYWIFLALTGLALVLGCMARHAVSDLRSG
jgi:MFS family permease